jgi:hypothetical protein
MFHFRMKEVLSLSDADFQRLKNELIKPATTTTTTAFSAVSEEATRYFLDREKDRKFEALFKELWPNLYNRAGLFEPAKTVSAAELFAVLEKNRSLYNLMLQQDLLNCKNLVATSTSTPSSLITATTGATIAPAKCGENINICINTAQPKVEITSGWTSLNPVTITKPVETSSYLISRNPNHISSYNSTTSYSGNLLKQIDDLNSFNTRENELIKSIQESQEKLKMTEKLERTNLIVDDIMNKVKELQGEIKRKSTSLLIKNEIEKLDKERENRLRRSSTSIYFENEPCTVCHKSRSKEKQCRLSFECRSSSREKHHSPHVANHNHKHIVSILKPTYSSRLPHRSSSSHRRRSSSRSRSTYVESKVDCWNPSYAKHDSNIY